MLHAFFKLKHSNSLIYNVCALVFINIIIELVTELYIVKLEDLSLDQLCLYYGSVVLFDIILLTVINRKYRIIF